MSDAKCLAFLQWALPRLGLRWLGYRRVRGQACKRIQRRLVQLGLPDLATYAARLEADPAEWQVLERLCVITISRFFRDRRVWDALRDEVLPAQAEAALAAGDAELRCWSIGCASGEEAYTLSLLWTLGLADRYPGLRLRILATDVDEHVLARARTAEYGAASLRELPTGWLERAFEQHDGAFRVRESFRAAVELRREDVRRALPDGLFRVILCRNVVFTYFEEASQRETLARILTRLAPGGVLIAGRHERVPSGAPLEPLDAQLGIHRHAPT